MVITYLNVEELHEVFRRNPAISENMLRDIQVNLTAGIKKEVGASYSEYEGKCYINSKIENHLIEIEIGEV